MPSKRLKKRKPQSPVPTGLLDLSNETLTVIGGYLNHNENLTLPSFFPHWQNLAERIDSQISKDTRSFRAVNQRLRNLTPLVGCHLVIRTQESLLAWTGDVPEKHLKSIRRLRIECGPPPEPESGPKEKVFQRFLTLLSRLPNLEEVQIGGEKGFGCQHFTRYPLKDDLWREMFEPPQQTFPKVKSLAIDVGCSFCYRNIRRFLLAFFPGVQHLKSGLTQGEYPSEIILFNPRSSEKAFSQIRVLYLRIPHRNSTFDVFAEIAEVCVSVEDLRIISYKGPNLDRDGPFIDVECDYFDDESHGEFLSPERKSYLMDPLSKLTKLAVIDLGLVLKVEGTPSPGWLYEVDRGTSLEQYEDSLIEQGSDFCHALEYEEAQKWVAYEMVKACPTLRKGYWWNFGDDRSYRREWTATVKPGLEEVKATDVISLERGGMFGFSDDFTECFAGAIRCPIDWDDSPSPSSSFSFSP